jgi:hypothetical protein
LPGFTLACSALSLSKSRSVNGIAFEKVAGVFAQLCRLAQTELLPAPHVAEVRIGPLGDLVDRVSITTLVQGGWIELQDHGNAPFGERACSAEDLPLMALGVDP